MATQDGSATGTQQAGATAEQVIALWLARHLDATITRIDRQGRWRPAWFVDAVTSDGSALPLYIRGEREQSSGSHGLRREYEVHRAMEAGGVIVPRLYGFIEELPASVMAMVPGRSNLDTCEDAAARDRILGELAGQMALIHSLDIAPFQEAGLALPDNAQDSALALFDPFHDSYQRYHQRPDPTLEFCARWVLRNVPQTGEAARFTVCDGGQFMFDGDRLTAMMDFEMSALGDPIIELASLRIRGQWEGLGDLPAFYERYEKISGRKVDRQRVRFHTAAFALAGALGSALAVDQYLASPSPNADYVEYQCWVVWEVKIAMEAIGEHMGMPLAYPVVPDPVKSPANGAVFALNAALGLEAGGAAGRDSVAAYRDGVRVAIGQHLDRIDQWGAAFEQEYLDDAAALLGARPASVEDANAQLEELVKQAGPDLDETLLRVLHRRVCRQAWLLAIPSTHYRKGLIEPLKPV
jgi:aminoglycoside phosphotransferase (APT) family kinase protein